jgi:RNA polymerase sigma-70 factor (ECF subfamily)
MAVVSEAPQADPLGLERVFVEHQRRVFRAAYRITGNAQDAEDVLQTVFLRLARREEGSLPTENLPSYLYRAAVNAAIDMLRARRDRESVALDETAEAVDVNATPDRAREAEEIRTRLRRSLARLSPRAAEVFVLRYLEDYGNSDIARMLGMSRVTVAVTLHRARHRLKRDFRGLRTER